MYHVCFVQFFYACVLFSLEKMVHYVHIVQWIEIKIAVDTDFALSYNSRSI